MSQRSYGADLCSIQGKIDAKKMKEGGIDFCYVQCTRYSKERDAGFQRYVDQLRDADIAVGAYHFCWQGGDPKQQAEHLFTSSNGLGLLPGELPPMLDWEFCKVIPESICTDFLVHILREVKGLWYPHGTDQSNRMPVVYTYPHFASQHPSMQAIGELAEYPLCIAYYGSGGALTPGPSEEPKLVPKPWQKATLWQYSGNGGLRVPGVQVDCDRQVYLGDDWSSFLGLDTEIPMQDGSMSDSGPIIHDMDSYFTDRSR